MKNPNEFDKPWSRRKILKNIGYYGGIALSVDYIVSGCARKFSSPGTRSSGKTQALASSRQIKKLMKNVSTTETYLQAYPNSYRKEKDYLNELKERTNKSSTAVWVEFQNNRLNHVRWVVDKHDDGRESGERLKMRPYDIPWLVWCFGVMCDEKRWEEYRNVKSFNGGVENVEKVTHSPNVEIEFTDKYADFCYVCNKMLADGCSAHPEYGGYGEVFPQPVQISPELKEDCELSLQVVNLKWSDVITGRNLMDLCVEKAPDPSKFDVFPLNEKNWNDYRLGIKWWKKNME